MNGKRVFAAVAGALVAGLVMGGAASGFAASTKATSTSGPVATARAAGLRLGASVRENGGRLLDIVTKLTGLTQTEVIAERKAGKTFAQIASAKGIDSSAVVAEAIKVRQTLLAEKVAAGTITQAQADAALTTMKSRLSARVDTANATCDGSGAGRGSGTGRGNGAGAGRGGMGGGMGRGNGGICAAPSAQ